MAHGDLTREEFWKLPEEERQKRYEELSDHDQFGVRQGMATGVVRVPCNECAHYHGFAKCDAFPDGIQGKHIGALIADPSTPCAEGFYFVPRKKHDQ